MGNTSHFSLALWLLSSRAPWLFQSRDGSMLHRVVEERFVNTVVVPRASPAHRAMLPLARRSSLWPPVHHVALVAAPAVRLSLVQGAPAAPSPPSSPTVFPALAGVAVNSTTLAITVQVARGQGFLGGAASHWSLLSLGSAARPAPESQRMCSCATSTCPSVPWTNAGSR